MQGKIFFADNLAFLMNAQKVSQGMLGHSVGVSQVAISRYLDGRIPKGPTLLKIASFFGVSADDLVNRDITPWAKDVVDEVYGLRRKRQIEQLEKRLGSLSDLEASRILALVFEILDCLDDARSGRTKNRKPG